MFDSSKLVNTIYLFLLNLAVNIFKIKSAILNLYFDVTVTLAFILTYF